MYEYINGRLAELKPAYAVIDTGGVGYILNISLVTYSELEKLREALLYTHFIVREDAQILFGFFSKEERELFRLLIGVSGVGGNTARTILSSFRPEELIRIVSGGDHNTLKSVKGLGTKTAQKIIVELKDKVAAGLSSAGDQDGLQTAGDQDRIAETTAALVMLGFQKSASEKTARHIISSNPDASVEEILRIALKNL